MVGKNGDIIYKKYQKFKILKNLKYLRAVDVNDDDAMPDEKCARFGAKTIGANGAVFAFCKY